MALEMAIKITIDKAGRLVVPHEIRTRLQIQPGDVLDIEAEDESIKVRPVREAATMVRRGWLLVAEPPTSPPALDVQEWIEKDREERARKVLGEWSSSTPRS